MFKVRKEDLSTNDLNINNIYEILTFGVQPMVNEPT